MTIQYKTLDFLGFPMYRVGDNGDVSRYLKTKNIWRSLRPQKCGKGYKEVFLSKNSEITRFTIHTLVLLAFAGPCPSGMECRHRNGKRDDNRFANLCWGTPEEQYRDKISHGTAKFGEEHHQTRLSKEDVMMVISMAKEDTARGRYERITRYMKSLGRQVCAHTIRNIVLGNTWAGTMQKVLNGR